MDRGKARLELERLISEAPRIAPSIARFAQTRDYGTVTDENLDIPSFIRWELESGAAFQTLAASGAPVFLKLHADYLGQKEAAKKFHNRSILVHRIMLLLTSAMQLLDSPWSEPPQLPATMPAAETPGWEALLHPVVRESALAQYADGHWRDAVLNAFIAVFDLVRARTGLDLDGERLATHVFSADNPILMLADLSTESGRNHQVGFMMVMQGAFRGIRNPKAHSLQHDLDALKSAQYLVMASLLARRVDEAQLRREP